MGHGIQVVVGFCTHFILQCILYIMTTRLIVSVLTLSMRVLLLSFWPFIIDLDTVLSSTNPNTDELMSRFGELSIAVTHVLPRFVNGVLSCV